MADREPFPTPVFSPGFRISRRDVVVLVLGAAATLAAASTGWWWPAAVIVFVLGHFFLFCNVFRVSRGLELAWAACFVLWMWKSTAEADPSWQAAFGLPLVLTAIVIALQVRKASYHGVGWRAINPKLPMWWETNMSGRAPEHPT